jgi:hypothetical protein
MRLRLFVALFAIGCAPLASRAADEENPYKKAKVGDYAVYKMNMKAGNFTITGTTTQKVTERSDKEATVKVTGSIDINGMKQEIPEQTQKIDLTKPYDPTKVGGGLPPGVKFDVEKGKEGKEKVKVNGKEYDSNWTMYKLKGKAMGIEFNGDVKSWMSKDVPLGMVKMEMTADVANMKMEMTMELSDSGNKK